MKKDAATVWENGFPYDVLEEMGITPNSNMKMIHDAALQIPKDRKAAVKPAFRELQEIPRRLMVDFFLYLGSVNPKEID
jgi:hypothetical protein